MIDFIQISNFHRNQLNLSLRLFFQKLFPSPKKIISSSIHSFQVPHFSKSFLDGVRSSILAPGGQKKKKYVICIPKKVDIPNISSLFFLFPSIISLILLLFLTIFFSLLSLSECPRVSTTQWYKKYFLNKNFYFYGTNLSLAKDSSTLIH